VTDTRGLSVEEVIARHQAAAARQRRQIRSLIASGTTVLTFQIPGLAAPMTISSETVVYQGPGISEVEQRRIRLNGLDYETENGGVPRLPIVEPERVSEPPLAISLTEAYRYRLEGREKWRGSGGYVVSLAPRVATAHASTSVIRKETPAGFRYLKRTGSEGDRPASPGAASPARVAAGKAQRVRTIAAGVLVDPNIDHPLPFAGLSYLDFDFL